MNDVIDGLPAAGFGANGSELTDGPAKKYITIPPYEMKNYATKAHTLAILTSSTGLENCCGHLENGKKGIVGKVYLNLDDITKNTWLHQAGYTHSPHKYLFISDF
jgi:hypothetical protein